MQLSPGGGREEAQTPSQGPTRSTTRLAGGDVGEKIEQELWRLAQEILRHGLNVVLDFGLWARAERNELRTAARDLGVGVELHCIGVPVDELRRRIDARNSLPPRDSEPITRAHLDDWHAAFQAPDATELALFDFPPR